MTRLAMTQVQVPGQSLEWANSNRIRGSGLPDRVGFSLPRTLPPPPGSSGFLRQWSQESEPWERPRHRQRGSSSAIPNYLEDAKRAIRIIAAMSQQIASDRISQLESRWLSRNRREFAGHWIALEGDELLAHGLTAREVFQAVSGRPNPPLVIRLEDADELPFAGW